MVGLHALSDLKIMTLDERPTFSLLANHMRMSLGASALAAPGKWWWQFPPMRKVHVKEGKKRG